jgi:phosphatidylglycerophosphate synthase
MRRYIPNALSLSRVILAILVIVASIRLDVATYVATLCMLVVAAITDGLDGYLARRWRATSELGYVLDTMGDRAIQLALVLVFLVRYSFHPLFAWLLIFRDIGIYAVRLLADDWFARTKRMRPLILFHTTTLRLWLGLFVLRDGVRVFTHADLLDRPAFEAVQFSLLALTLTLSYYGLFRSGLWLIEKDHETSRPAQPLK